MGNLAIFVNRLAHGCCVDRTPTANHTVSRPICQPQSSREMATLRRSPRDTTRSHASLCLAWSYASGGQGIRTLNRSSRHLISSQAANHSRTLRMNLGRVGGPLGLPRRRPTGLARATTTQDSRLPLRQCRSASPHRPPTVPRWPDRRFPRHFGRPIRAPASMVNSGPFPAGRQDRGHTAVNVAAIGRKHGFTARPFATEAARAKGNGPIHHATGHPRPFVAARRVFLRKSCKSRRRRAGLPAI